MLASASRSATYFFRLIFSGASEAALPYAHALVAVVRRKDFRRSCGHAQSPCVPAHETDPTGTRLGVARFRESSGSVLEWRFALGCRKDRDFGAGHTLERA
jgi:hypothetical protein